MEFYYLDTFIFFFGAHKLKTCSIILNKYLNRESHNLDYVRSVSLSVVIDNNYTPIFFFLSSAYFSVCVCNEWVAWDHSLFTVVQRSQKFRCPCAVCSRCWMTCWGISKWVKFQQFEGNYRGLVEKKMEW